MAPRSVLARAWSPAPLEDVWALLADGEGWATFMPMVRHARLEREGAPVRDGVGAIRALGAGPAVSREEVVAFEPPSHLGYVSLSGFPVEGYRADVTLAAERGGTAITWASSWRRSPLGPLLRGFLTVVLRAYARALAREAGRRRGRAATSGKA